MNTSVVIAFSVWLAFLFLFACSLGAAVRAFPEAPIKRYAPYHPFPRWKRILDLFCIACFLPIGLPLSALIAVAIKLCSRGPVLFRQERIGFFGQPFQCLKFRTMMVNADTRSHETHFEKLLRSSVPMTKLDAFRDSRLIPLGWLLRATGLDELPQLLNVLRGEMTLVGPRPCLRYEFERFTIEQRQRFNAVPGITGLWQVSGKNKTTFQRMIELDIAYGKNMSLLCDIGILFRTGFVVLEQTAQAVTRQFAVRALELEAAPAGVRPQVM